MQGLQIRKEEIKLSLLKDDIIVSVGNPKESPITQKQNTSLETIND